jgi:drug/metabolite transporter (DMT)-like permease
VILVSATKVALQDVSPVTVVWLRFSMGLVILGFAVAMRKQFSLPDRNEWAYFALLGFLRITFHQWLQSNGLQTSESGTTAWIASTTPVFMALLGWTVLDERLGWLKITGIVLAFGGVLLVVSKGDLASVSIGRLGAPGDKLILVSAVNWAVFSVLSRRGLKSQTGAFLYIEPLIAVVVAFFVLGEPVMFISLIGGGIILFGVWLVNR